MLKEKSRTTWIIAIGLFVVLTIIIGSMSKFVQNVTHEEAIAVEINSEQIETGIRIDKESKSADTFTSYTMIPSTSIEAIDLPIFDWVQEQEDKFYKEMHETKEHLDENFVAHFNLDTSMHKIVDNVYTVEMKIDQAVEQSKEYVSMKTFVIDLNQEKIIQPTDIFDENKFTAKDRFQLIVKQLDEKVKYDEWEEALEDLNEIEFTLHEDEFTFYFNDKQLRKENKTFEVNIPIVHLVDYFEEDYYNIFVTDEIIAELEQLKIEEEQERQDAIENHKYIALTFDDGPEVGSTERILDTLDKYDAKATFFMLSRNVEQNPEIAKRVADEGHEIANHTITHADLNAVNSDRIRQEMTDSLAKIEQTTGIKPTLFRPPYGSKNDLVESIAQETDQAVIMWSIDTYDWKHRNASTTFTTVKNYVRPGSIILMHDIHQTTADALPQIMEYLHNEGYEFVTVSELLPYIEGEGIGPYFGS